MDYTALVTAVDWSAALTALGAVAVAAAGLYIAIRGARTVLGFIKR